MIHADIHEYLTPKDRQYWLHQVRLHDSLVRQADNALDKRRCDRHEQLLDEALKVCRRLDWWKDQLENPPATLHKQIADFLITDLGCLAISKFYGFEPEAAIDLLEEASNLCETVFQDDHKEFFVILEYLADAYQQTGRLLDCETVWRKVVAAKEQRLGRWHPEVAESLEALSHACAGMDKGDEAKELLERAAEIYERHEQADVASTTNPGPRPSQMRMEHLPGRQRSSVVPRRIAIAATTPVHGHS